MSIFKRTYYYIVGEKENGRPMLYGALRMRGKDGKFGTGDYCKDENEARQVASEILKNSTRYEIRTSTKRNPSEATKEWKGFKFAQTGDFDMAGRRVSHKVNEKEKDNDNQIELYSTQDKIEEI